MTSMRQLWLLVILLCLAVPAAAQQGVRSSVPPDIEVFNVKDFGAVCNSDGRHGGIDDSAAINAAIVAARASGRPFTLESPGNATCFIAHSINATNLSGNVAPNGVGYGTRIRLRLDCATNGTPCIDALQSRGVAWDELYIYGELTHVPNIGIQIGIAATSDACADNFFVHPEIFGGFSFTAFYNVGSETTSVLQPFFENTASGRALVEDGYNHFAVSSAFVTVTLPADHPISLNENTFIGGTYGALNTAPLWFGNANRHKIIGGYCVNVVGHIADLYFEGGQLLSQLDLDCHTEVAPHLTDVFWLTGTNASVQLRGLHWRDQSTWASNSVLKIDPDSSIKSASVADLEVNIGGSDSSNQNLVVFDNPALWNYVSGRFQLPTASMYNAPIGTINGIPITTGTVCILGLQCTQLVPTPPLNRNPDFVLDQPNTGAPMIISAPGQFLLDGWHGLTNDSGRISVQRTKAAPAPGFVYAWLANTLATFTPVPDAYSIARTAIEGADLAPLNWGMAQAQPVSVDVCLEANNPGTYSAFVQNGSHDLSYILDFAIVKANVWQCFHKVIPGPRSGLWTLEANQIGLFFGFNFYAGSGKMTVPDAWRAGNFHAGTNTTQLSTVGMTLKIGALHIYPGEIALPYQPRSFAAELTLAQRFARTSFPLGTTPAPNSGNAAGAVTLIAPFGKTISGSVGTYVAYPPMFHGNFVTRFYSTHAASTNCYDATQGADVGAASAVNQGDSGFFLQCALAAGVRPGDRLQVHYMIDTGL